MGFRWVLALGLGFGLSAAQGQPVRTAPVRPDYLRLQLIRPELPVPDHEQSLEHGDRHLSFGPARVDVRGLQERSHLGGLRLEGHHLRIGGVLGSLRAGTLDARLEQTVWTPVLEWRGWRPHFHFAPRRVVVPLLHRTGSGVGMVARVPLIVPMPFRIQLDVRQKNGRLERTIRNRDEILSFIERQIDRLFDPAVVDRHFRFYVIDKPGLLDPVVDRVFEWFHAQVVDTVRANVKDRILNQAFLESFLDQAFALLPPVSLGEGQAAVLEWERETGGPVPAWSLTYSKAGSRPSDAMARDWPVRDYLGRPNTFRLAVTGNALQHLLEDTLANLPVLEGQGLPLELPPGLEVDAAGRRFRYLPQSAAEAEGLLLLLRDLANAPSAPEEPVLSVAFPAHGWEHVTFSPSSRGTRVGVRVALSLENRGDAADRLGPVTLDLGFDLSPDGRLELATVSPERREPPAGRRDSPLDLLRQLGPGLQTVLLRGLVNERIREAYARIPDPFSDLSRVLRIGRAGDEALTVEFLEPLAIE